MKIHNPEKLGLSKDKLKEMEAFFKKILKHFLEFPMCATIYV